MRLAVLSLLQASVTVLAWASSPLNPPPTFVASGVVNAASSKTGPIAPNTLMTVYGAHLAWDTNALKPEAIRNGRLPTEISGAGVRVLVGAFAAPLLFVSPTQINFLVPSNIKEGSADIHISLDNRYGPPVKVQVAAASPALFLSDPEHAVATRADGRNATWAEPAKPGDIVVLYATGLGATNPPSGTGEILPFAAPIRRSAEFRLQIAGSNIEPSRVRYVGLTPGFAGLYQINVHLPDNLPEYPEVRIGYEGTMSPEGIRLPVRAVQ